MTFLKWLVITKKNGVMTHDSRSQTETPGYSLRLRVRFDRFQGLSTRTVGCKALLFGRLKGLGGSVFGEPPKLWFSSWCGLFLVDHQNFWVVCLWFPFSHKSGPPPKKKRHTQMSTMLREGGRLLVPLARPVSWRFLPALLAPTGKNKASMTSPGLIRALLQFLGVAEHRHVWVSKFPSSGCFHPPTLALGFLDRVVFEFLVIFMVFFLFVPLLFTSSFVTYLLCCVFPVVQV